MADILNYIDGDWVGPTGKLFFDNVDPARGEAYSRVPDSDERDVAAAVQAAQVAFPAWSAMPVQQRANLLLKVADLIDRDLEILSRAESRDQGKPVKLARVMDIPRASANLRFFATGIIHFASEAHATDSEAINYTLRTPVGVVEIGRAHV